MYGFKRYHGLYLDNYPLIHKKVEAMDGDWNIQILHDDGLLLFKVDTVPAELYT